MSTWMYASWVQAEIITIGDEICRGEIIDTNAAWMSAFLWDLDITTHWMTSCRDEPEDMRDAFRRASTRADVILCSGGLGPTIDDRTCDIVSELCGTQAAVHEPSFSQMKDRYAAMGREMAEKSHRQVRSPQGSITYLNPAGAAPGFQINLGESTVICLPGPPRELHAIATTYLNDALVALREARGEDIERMSTRIYRVFGLPESELASRLDHVDLPKGASLHYQVKFPEILIKTVARASTQNEANNIIDSMESIVMKGAGKHIHGQGKDSLPVVLGRELTQANQSLAIAESCTGGLISSMLTAEPGASAFFLGSMVTYANAEKMRQLGVTAEVLSSDGAVSEACVRQMAIGCKERSGADLAVAVSGIAGPGGGSEEKPVGLVWLAAVGPKGEVKTKRLLWPGRRDRIRLIAAYAALHLVRGLAKDKS